MSRRAILATSLSLLVFSLTLAVQPAVAVYPPYQNVQASVNGLTISYWVYNVPGSQESWTLQGKYDARFEYLPNFPKCQEGIVAWVVSYLDYTWSDPGNRSWEVHYRVYDPGRGGWQEGHTTFGGTEGGWQRKVWDWDDNHATEWFQIKHGVLAFLSENTYGGSVRAHHLHLLTYDPGAGGWQKERRTFLFQDPNLGAQWLTLKDGVVAWAVGGQANNTSFWDFLGAFYKIANFVADCVDGNWVGLISDAYGIYQGLENISAGDSRRTVYFSIYDPAAPLPGWVTSCYYPTLTYDWMDNSSLSIQNATANIQTCWLDPDLNEIIPANHYAWGYSHNQGAWLYGVDTVPVAYFYAQPSSGPASLPVQFWDMSMAPRSGPGTGFSPGHFITGLTAHFTVMPTWGSATLT